MNVEIISRLNVLWRPIYPWLATWIGQWVPAKRAWVLELGIFSGGISDSLMTLYPDIKTICLMPQENVAKNISDSFESNFKTVISLMSALPFRDPFDLAIFRGAFFFLTPEIILEAHRVLKPGGHALLGGGYGPLTPPEEIAEIADESKRLNYLLGKKWLSREMLEEMVRETGLMRYSQILEEGGLWLLLKKDST